MAGTPPACDPFLPWIRWCRFARPPAKGFDPSGIRDAALVPKAGGFLACSRWSSEATPPDSRRMTKRTPAGVPAALGRSRGVLSLFQDSLDPPNDSPAHSRTPSTRPTTPRHIPGLPRPVPGFPRHAEGLPRHIPGLPWPVPGLPQPAQGLPQPAPGLPQPAQGLPRHAEGLPRPVQGLPRHVQGLPCPVQGLPQTGQGVLISSRTLPSRACECSAGLSDGVSG